MHHCSGRQQALQDRHSSVYQWVLIQRARTVSSAISFSISLTLLDVFDVWNWHPHRSVILPIHADLIFKAEKIEKMVQLLTANFTFKLLGVAKWWYYKPINYSVEMFLQGLLSFLFTVAGRRLDKPSFFSTGKLFFRI